MLIVYRGKLTDGQKLAVRNAVIYIGDDEFVILLQTAQAIYGDKKKDKVIVKEVMNKV